MNRAAISGYDSQIHLDKKDGIVAFFRDENISTRHPGMWTISSPVSWRTDMYEHDGIMNTVSRRTVSTMWLLDNMFERYDAVTGYLAVNLSTHRPGKNTIGSPEIERTDNEVK
jgi:hypothetical protein